MYGFSPSGAVTTNIAQATYTGGAAGTPTYAWSMVAPNASGASFANPANASSQAVSFTGIAPSSQKIQGVRLTVTDSLGNVSTDDMQAIGERT